MTDHIKSGYEMAFDILAAFPDGLTHFELVDLLPAEAGKPDCTSARLSQMVKEGLARKVDIRQNGRTGVYSAVYAPTGLPFSERKKEERAPERKRHRPRNADLRSIQSALDAAKADIALLEAWKASAISRFPELAVDPIVFAARQRFADILREDGNASKAILVMAGELDDGETMRALISLLKGQGDA